MIPRISHLVSRVQRRLEGEEGFTLVEAATIVMLIFGILLTIALPSYLSLQDRANKTAAKQDIAQAMKAVIAYGNDNYSSSPADPDASVSTTDNGYQNISLSALATRYDASISTTPGAPFVMNPAGYSGSSASIWPHRLDRPLDRGPARRRRRHLRRDAVHARHLHCQLGRVNRRRR